MRISDWSSDVCSSDLVDILYDHQDAGVRLYQASILAGAAGIVIAGTGNGSLSPGAARGSLLARRRGLTCVRSSRVPSGEVGDRKSVVVGKRVSVRVDLGGRRILKKKTNTQT